MFINRTRPNSTQIMVNEKTEGFPSPADDFIDKQLDLNKLVVRHPVSTYFLRVEGDKMFSSGLRNDDLLVVDLSLKPQNGDIVIAVVDGELIPRIFQKIKNKSYLVTDNEFYQQKKIAITNDFEIWGVVTHVVSAKRN